MIGTIDTRAPNPVNTSKTKHFVLDAMTWNATHALQKFVKAKSEHRPADLILGLVNQASLSVSPALADSTALTALDAYGASDFSNSLQQARKGWRFVRVSMGDKPTKPDKPSQII